MDTTPTPEKPRDTRIDDALVVIENNLALMHDTPFKAAIITIRDNHNGLSNACANLGVQVLGEMQKAADWQAVATKFVWMLRNRKKPGFSKMIKQALTKIDEATRLNAQLTPPGETPESQKPQLVVL